MIILLQNCLLVDESPNCYKPAKDVINAVVKAGLARVAYELTPIASLKDVFAVWNGFPQRETLPCV